MSIPKITEYVAGFRYFYIRQDNGKTISLDRQSINKVEKKTRDGKYREVKLKKPRTKAYTNRKGDIDNDEPDSPDIVSDSEAESTQD
jgi:hypothetical protein